MSLIALPIISKVILPALDITQKFVSTALEYSIQQKRLNFEQYRHEQEQKIQRELLVEARRRSDLEGEQFAASLDMQWKIAQAERAMARESLAAQRKLQWEMAVFQYENLVALAAEQRKTTLASEEYKRILDHYAWNVFPTPLLESFNSSDNRAPLPLLVIISPPELVFDHADQRSVGLLSIERTLSEGIRSFLGKYSQKGRHVKFLGGLWKSKQFHSESAVTNLFWMFRSLPTLILESETDGDYLNLRAAFWGIGQDKPLYETILSRLPYLEILHELAREDAGRWREVRARYLEAGLREEEIKERGREDESNLRALEEEEQDRKVGIQRNYSYIVTKRHVERLAQILTACHCLVAGWAADAYHLVNHRMPPLLPELLPSFPSHELVSAVTATIAPTYRNLYESVGAYLPGWMPDLYLQLASSLARSPNQSAAVEYLKLSMFSWLRLSGHPLPGDDDPLAALEKVAEPADQLFVTQLLDVYSLLSDHQSSAKLQALVSSWREQKIQGRLKRDASGDLLYDLWG